jgi:hypothetical protein
MTEKKEPETLVEIIEALKETFKEIAEDRKQAAEERKQSAEERKAIDKQIKAMQDEIGGMGKTDGEVAQELIFNSLKRDMTFAGIEFDDILPFANKYSKKLEIKAEYDALLLNCDTAGIVEIKQKVRLKDVLKLNQQRVDDFRKLYKEYADYKIILGIAGLTFEKQAIKEIEERGIVIIKLAGDKLEYNTDNIKIY